MKKKIFVFAAALALTVSSALAAVTGDVPSTVVNELHTDFKGVTDVQWKITGQYYKASFTSNGISLEAFYDTDGNFLVVSRNITVDQLPLQLALDSKEKSSAGKITGLIEMSSKNGTEYYMDVETPKHIITYKSSGSEWSRY